MKKQERTERAERRSRELATYAEQDAAVHAFVNECRIAMAPSEFERFHAEAEATAGNSFHIFEAMIYALSCTETQIPPALRKAIDSILGLHEVDRDRIVSLSTLQYDAYWKRQYGYD